MDPRLLRYYNEELRYLREMGAEFAKEYPKIAGRLGMENLEVADPYVERLLEGFAFLASRVQLKVDAEFPRFTQHLLERVYPHYLAPTPSMAVVQFQPDFTESDLIDGPVVPRHTTLRSLMGKDDQTPCLYRSAHEVTLWPLQLTEAEYLGTAAAVKALGIGDQPGLRAGIRLRLKLSGEANFNQIPLDRLTLYLRGADALPMHLYEQCIGDGIGLAVLPTERPASWIQRLPRSSIRQIGFEDDQALLPYGPRSFQGYRLLAEYFAFPQRYLFIELTGLRAGLQRCPGREVDLLILLDHSDPLLEQGLDPDHFTLFCTPAINLFPKRADRIHLSERFAEHHIIPDRTRPLDFEIHSVTSVTGHGVTLEEQQEFLPFYASSDIGAMRGHQAYYVLRREPRRISTKARRTGPRSSYIGSEIFVSLVDASEAPYRSDLRQLAIHTLCTNRDLPLHMPIDKGPTDFTLEAGAPIKAVRCLNGPTRPRPSSAEREIAWRLINHLNLNYLSLADNSPEHGAAALRELLLLYCPTHDTALRKQVEDGVGSIQAQPVTQRLPVPGPIAFGRGLEITLTLEESAFEGAGAFLLGAVMERFFARYVSVNTFTQTRVRSTDRGEIMRWPVRSGLRQTL
ncbi:MAG: type VI secretion system baseplate subunit TssF [Candidatus Competibacterales bacterium]|nr:type VI secretion system baseplate subunit TssF [Candidatus Competibacterales bacterium]